LLKEFEKWAESITAEVRTICAAQAEQLNIPMIYLNSAAIDKEAYARRIMMERKVLTWDICMFSTVEPCQAALLKGNRSTGKLELKMAPRKCIWIYHHCNNENIGFGHTRLQTWLPLSVILSRYTTRHAMYCEPKLLSFRKLMNVQFAHFAKMISIYRQRDRLWEMCGPPEESPEQKFPIMPPFFPEDSQPVY
jgi:hypothetical protein